MVFLKNMQEHKIYLELSVFLVSFSVYSIIFGIWFCAYIFYERIKCKKQYYRQYQRYRIYYYSNPFESIMHLKFVRPFKIYVVQKNIILFFSKNISKLTSDVFSGTFYLIKSGPIFLIIFYPLKPI